MADTANPVDDGAPRGSSAPLGSYEASVRALYALVSELPSHPPVTRGKMFNGDGVKVRERVFAFIGRNGDLVAKVPESRVSQLVSEHTGRPVVMGRRTMREWVRLPAEVGVGAWSDLLEEAYSFGLTLAEP